MPTVSNIKKGGVVTVAIKVAGKVIPSEAELSSVMVEKHINRVSTAKITIIDGCPNSGKFNISSSDTFIPGKDISIEAGYDSDNKVIFKGIISKQSIKVENSRSSNLIIECRDPAVKMIVGRKSLTYSKKKDSDIMASIIETYDGLSHEITTTDTEWQEQVQYYATDWDFILSRAEANGLVVTTLNGKVSAFKPDADTTSVLTVKYGDNLINFNADLNSITQLDAVKAASWNYKTQEIETGEASVEYKGAGNLSSEKLSKVVGLSDFQLQTSASLEQSELTNWTKAQLVKSEFSKIRGDVTFQGTDVVEPGKYMTLEGVGDRFNGNHLISGVTHNITTGNWTSEVIFGLSPIWFTDEPDVMSPPAAGLLPGTRGLFNGTVKKIYEDPNTQLRILVDVPLFDQNGEGLWARLTNFYSTSGAGIFFLPEVGDEVILGFLNEDPRYPIILGSLYSSSKIMPFEGLEPNEKNSLKAIVSKSGIFIQFDDEKKVLTINTPNNNTAILSDKDKTITIRDQSNNSIVMSDSGVVIKSPKDITIEADQNLILKGNQGVKIEASGGDVEISGVNIKETADSQYSAEGSETAQINSGMELTLKSAMIMIN